MHTLAAINISLATLRPTRAAKRAPQTFSDSAQLSRIHCHQGDKLLWSAITSEGSVKTQAILHNKGYGIMLTKICNSSALVLGCASFELNYLCHLYGNVLKETRSMSSQHLYHQLIVVMFIALISCDCREVKPPEAFNFNSFPQRNSISNMNKLWNRKSAIMLKSSHLNIKWSEWYLLAAPGCFNMAV